MFSILHTLHALKFVRNSSQIPETGHTVLKHCFIMRYYVVLLLIHILTLCSDLLYNSLLR